MSQGVDNVGVIGSTIRLLNGHYFDLVRPDPDLIDLTTIAISLGRECRYGNQCPKFYSVAEHCVLMSRLYRGHRRAEILLHDASEAYIGDVAKPLKLLLPDYQKIELGIEAAIAVRFGLDTSEAAAEDIRYYDRMLLKAEKLTFWPGDKAWPGFENIERVDVEFEYWPPDKAAEEFLCEVARIGIE